MALTLATLLGSAPLWAQTVDGTRDASYPAALAVQTVNTEFGDNNAGSQTSANGSELDNIHARIVGANLYLFIGGNLQSSFNKLDIFFDSQVGGLNQLAGSSNFYTPHNGLKFDAGFTADFAISVTCGNGPLEVYANYSALPGSGADFIGGGVGRTQTLTFSNVTLGASNGTVSIDNSNVAGVGAGTGAANTAAATAVSTGIEFRIPLNALGSSQYAGDIKVCAFINNDNNNYVSNQVLGGLAAGQGNLGGDNNGGFTGTLSGVDFSVKTGNQFVTVLNTPPTIDGGLDGIYSDALAVQTIDTQFGNNSNTSQESANGSEIDNIHAEVIGSDLYVFVAGNVQDNFNKLDLFFDSKPGGQNQLTGNSQYVSNMNGLKFDAGFAADYALAMTNGNSPLEVYTNYVPIPTGGIAGDFTGGGAGRTQTLDFNAVVPGNGTGQIGVDNSNNAGVGSGTGAANQAAAEAVSTGVEYRIPLSALGTSAGAGDIKIAAFINASGWNFLSNQVLGGLPAGTGNLGGPSGVDFSSLAGNQFVTVSNGGVTTQPEISVSPASLNFYNVSVAGGTVNRTITITNNGNSVLNVTNIVSSNAAFAPSSTSFNVAPAASQNVTITFDPSLAGVNSGTLAISSNDPNAATVNVSVTGRGIAVGQVVVDGRVDASLYGSPMVLQTTPTGFGNSNSGSATLANGSELDAAYTYVSGGFLHVMLTGNLETNNNKLVVFFDTNHGTGQQVFNGANPSVDFGNSNNMAGFSFEPGFRPEYFLSLNLGGSNLFASFVTMNGGGGNGIYLTPSVNDFTAPLIFGGAIDGEVSVNNSNTAGVSDVTVGNPGAVNTGVELKIPLSEIGNPGSLDPIRVMALVTSGDYGFMSNQFLGGLPNGTANLGAPGTQDLHDYAGNQFVTAQRGDVTINSPEQLSGDFRNVIVANGGELEVTEAFDVSGTMTVQTGGSVDFRTSPEPLTGDDFALQAGGTVYVGSIQGLTSSGATGDVQTTTRSFGTNGIFHYADKAGAVTGNAVSTMRELYIDAATPSAGSVTLSQDVNVRELVKLTKNLQLDNRALRLLSDASGTATLWNSGGVAVGNTGEMEIALNNAFTGRGYRHYSTPTSGMTFGQMAAGSFTPVVNALYNSTPNPSFPGNVVPFPNIFSFSEPLATTTFVNGYQSPANLADLLGVGTGYAVNLTGSPKMVFNGTFNNGNVPVSVSKTGNTTNSGFNMVGNPYPSPMDWDNQTIPSGMANQVSVFQPAANGGNNGGAYLTYVNGVGSLPGGIIPAAQGMFVRRSTLGSGTLTFVNAARTTAYSTTNHYRTATETRPVVRLDVNGTGALAGLTDAAFVYFENGATDGLDDQYDAVRVSASVGGSPTISAQLADGTEVQIDGRPAFTQDYIIPLVVRVGVTGTYEFNASELLNFAAGQQVLLVDAVTGTTHDLTANPSYTFSMDASFQGPRFSLHFAAGRVTGTVADAANALLSVYPNPSNGSFTVSWAGTQPLTGEVSLIDALGRTVRQLPAAGRLSVTDLPKGVYTLRAISASGPLTRRVVID